MIGKLFVLVATFGGLWLVIKLLGKVGAQNKELQVRRARETKRKADELARREADIIDLEQDPETGEFEEKR